MSYLYFPGCSLKSTGRAYEESLLALFRSLEKPLVELDDWNCCGATAYMSVSELKAFALCARNFALAERQRSDDPSDLVVPCAACYLGLVKAMHYLKEHLNVLEKVNRALGAAGLEYTNRTKVRHPLDVLVNDIGADAIASRVRRPLTGLRVACYYGCQLVRPYALFDDQHEPVTMETLMQSLGADVIDWPIKTRCCGGSLTGTVQEVGLRLSHIILSEAAKRGCDVIVTACPLCQFNLECYQKKMSSIFSPPVDVPVLYFTQLMGMALGVPQKEVGLQRLMVPLKPLATGEVAAGGIYVNQ